MFFEFDIFFIVFFSFVGAVILFMAVRGIIRWKKNKHISRLTVDATVAVKRMKVTQQHHHTGLDVRVSSRVAYYVTFRAKDGDKIELLLTASEFNELTEGDFGKLTFQGTTYLGFKKRILKEKADTDAMTEVVADEGAEVVEVVAEENADGATQVTSEENSEAVADENSDVSTEEHADGNPVENTDESAAETTDGNADESADENTDKI